MRLRPTIGRAFAACVVVASVAAVAAVASAAAPRAASAATPAPAWTVSVGTGAVAMPVVYQGRAFTDDGPLVTAVGLMRGNVAWQVDHTESGYAPFLGVPSLVSGQIAVPWDLAEFAGLFDHDPKTGAFTSPNNAYVLGHIVTRGTHHASLDESFAQGNRFISLDDGRPGHAGYIDFIPQGGQGEPYSDPVIVGDHVWIGYGGSLMRFDRRGPCPTVPQDTSLCLPNGTADIIGNIVGLAAGPNGTVVATTDNGFLQVFDGATGAELWRSTGSPNVTAPTVGDGFIMVGRSEHSTRTGELFAYPAGGCGAPECSPGLVGSLSSEIVSAPSIGDGLAVVGTRDRRVTAFSIADCTAGPCSRSVLGRVASPITGGPVVGGGTVVVGTATGDLVGFRTP